MSVKIKVSFLTDEEFKDILKLLRPVYKKHKIVKSKDSKFYNAYIEVKEH
jgi:hypothetical protein